MRKKTDDQKDMERWNVDMSGEFSAVPMQYAERKKLEHEESQIEEARKLTKDYSDEELRKMKPKQLYSVIMRQCYAYKQVKRGWLDIYLERMDAPEQILEAEILIKKFQTNGWFGDHCLRLPEQVVDAAINMKRPDWALDFLRDNMTFRFFPRAETFQKLMNHYSSLGDFAGVLTVWQVQKNRGYHANKSTIHCLLKAYVDNNEIPSAAWVVSRAFKKKDLFDDSNLELALPILINHRSVASSQGVSLNNFVEYLKEHESLVLSENTNGLLSLAHLQSGKIDSVVALASKSKDLDSFFQSYTTYSSLFSSPSSKEQLSQLLNSLSSQNIQFPDSLKKLTETPQPEPEAPSETTENPSTESETTEQPTETTETKEN